MALPQGHYYGGTTGTIQVIFAYVFGYGSGQRAWESGEGTAKGSVNCSLRLGAKDSQDFVLELFVAIILREFIFLFSQKLFHFIYDFLW